jgi:hypothetical protein
MCSCGNYILNSCEVLLPRTHDDTLHDIFHASGDAGDVLCHIVKMLCISLQSKTKKRVDLKFKFGLVKWVRHHP